MTANVMSPLPKTGKRVPKSHRKQRKISKAGLEPLNKKVIEASINLIDTPEHSNLVESPAIIHQTSTAEKQ